MWLTLLVTVVTYLLSSRGTSEERRQALVNAGLAGGATYVATEYTDWGRDVSDKFDSAIGVSSKTNVLPAGQTRNADGSITDASGAIVKAATTGTVGAPNKTTSTGGSFWDSLASWGPTTTALVAGGAGLALGSGSSLLWIGAIVVVGIMVLK